MMCLVIGIMGVYIGDQAGKDEATTQIIKDKSVCASSSANGIKFKKCYTLTESPEEDKK